MSRERAFCYRYPKTNVLKVAVISYSVSIPSHLGMSPLHITLSSSRWHVMVSAPCVLMKPSSQTTEMELPSWKLSPKRLPFKGMPGSGHSLCPKACNEKRETSSGVKHLQEMRNGVSEYSQMRKMDVAVCFFMGGNPTVVLVVHPRLIACL